MRFILLSDLHLMWDSPVGRLDNIWVAQKSKLKYVLDEWARDRRNTIVLQAGDFFDRPRNWYLLAEIVSLLREYKAPIFCVYGNPYHDGHTHLGSRATSLGVLEKAGLVEILGKESVYYDLGEAGMWHLWGAGYGELLPVPPEECDYNILVVHRMVVGRKIWAGQKNYELASGFLRRHNGYDLILCGDAHQKFLHKTTGGIICNAGCMTRKSVDLWDHKPGFFIFNTDDMDVGWERIPYEPPEDVLSRDHIEKREETGQMFKEFVRNAGKEFEPEVHFMDNLQRFIEEKKIDQEVVDVLLGVMQ